MFVRPILAALAVGLSVGAVVAQSDPIAARKALMKANDDNARSVVQMMRGAAAVRCGQRSRPPSRNGPTTAQKLPALFPDNSKTGGETAASPKIWLNKKDFDAKAAAFAKSVADKAATRPKDRSTASRRRSRCVGKACDNCHEDYRLPKQ